jgi:hypothetical protein
MCCLCPCRDIDLPTLTWMVWRVSARKSGPAPSLLTRSHLSINWTVQPDRIRPFPTKVRRFRARFVFLRRNERAVVSRLCAFQVSNRLRCRTKRLRK